MDSASNDVPRIVVFPPLIPMGTLVLASLLQWLHPLGLLRQVELLGRAPAGIALLAIGVTLMVCGGRALARDGTNVDPSHPTLRLVTNGVYRRTRNPLYLGGSCAMFGVASIFGLDWLPILYIPSFAILHFGVVVPEERYLEHKFGDQYRRYRARVPRYFGTADRC
jgi:protein-S-isoprenylcysteine O-methyltransferase Ste14